MVILALICLIVAYLLGKQYHKFREEELRYRMYGEKASGMIIDNEESDDNGVRIKVSFLDKNGKEQTMLSNKLKNNVQTYPIGKKINITYLLEGDDIKIIVDHQEKQEYQKNLFLALCIVLVVLGCVLFVL